MREAFQLLTVSAVASLWLAALAGAQTSTSTAPRADTATPRVVTIVGCVVQGRPAGDERSSSPASPNTTAADDYFVRTPSMSVPAGSSVTIGSSGTVTSPTGTGTTAAPPQPSGTALYRITGLARDQLHAHVGHRVEFQGRLTESAPATHAHTKVDAAGRTTTTVDSKVEIAGVIEATAIKMVSATCP